jgi:hypothetical protein
MTLLEALRAGVVQSASGTFVQPNGTKIENLILPRGHWEYFTTNSSFWTTGQHTYKYRDPSSVGYVQFRVLTVAGDRPKAGSATASPQNIP